MPKGVPGRPPSSSRSRRQIRKKKGEGARKGGEGGIWNPLPPSFDPPPLSAYRRRRERERERTTPVLLEGEGIRRQGARQPTCCRCCLLPWPLPELLQERRQSSERRQKAKSRHANETVSRRQVWNPLRSAKLTRTAAAVNYFFRQPPPPLGDAAAGAVLDLCLRVIPVPVAALSSFMELLRLFHVE